MVRTLPPGPALTTVVPTVVIDVPGGMLSSEVAPGVVVVVIDDDDQDSPLTMAPFWQVDAARLKC
ncbi:hypothetical protein CH63R_04785 [Colletotrichum higginsianum IMI 349063]|uniref:Uncharacterized protein n=1 Tax=Colletotrichum higginsianum (strain IMI 349063) TaxID=759273 RepID=A0A1B7YK97_COLHI|nr:hypothetical protein CH63R_04785 [Colletotrichum higginsianum IMI 349063]OBR12489.1 hypothetical protein CH63R_04785 [Colletotrichum higginsianum IMI 349063]GJC94164.1 hypothetical protein ColKHC_02990 [Colletotrichum higginsianum]